MQVFKPVPQKKKEQIMNIQLQCSRFLAENHEAIDSLVSSLQMLDSGKSEGIAIIVDETMHLEKSARASRLKELHAICTKTVDAATAFRDTDNQHDTEEHLLLLKECTNVFKMLRLLPEEKNGCGGLDCVLNRLRTVRRQTCEMEADKLALCSGLRLTLAPNTLILQIPQTKSHHEEIELLDDLLSIWDTTPQDCGWVVDLSNVSRIPVMILGALVNYQDQMRCPERQFRLHGIRPDLLSAESMERLKQRFEVR